MNALSMPETMTEAMVDVWQRAFAKQLNRRRKGTRADCHRQHRYPETCEAYAWRALIAHLQSPHIAPADIVLQTKPLTQRGGQ
ncbi:hypothetical protein [Methylorubrum populi]|uniref:hypothetical protein n=1 Tax=Methylorubrum populi TaxID=223967 RepID=UPI0012FFB42F|nr:hypothetical protein [Methylorubrum populi]